MGLGRPGNWRALGGDVIEELNEAGDRIVGDTLLLLLNASDRLISFALPAQRPGQRWQLEFDTSGDREEFPSFTGGDTYPLQPRSLSVLRIATD